MAPDSILQVVILAVLIILGAYFAAAETAYSGVNKIRLKSLAEDGNKRAGRALDILKKFESALTTILICTNIVHLTCASISTILATRLWGSDAVVYSTVITTVAVFFVAEMLPKSIAINHAEELAMAFSASLLLLMKLLLPISFTFSAIGKGLKKLLRVTPEPEVTEDEIYEMIDTINDEGVMSDEKSELIRSAVEFDRVSVRNVLTPRVDAVMIDIDIDDASLRELLKTDKHSRLPVYEGTVDNIIGVLRVTRYLRAWATAKSRPPLRLYLDKPLFVPGTAKIDELLDQMSSHKHHMAIVNDEYGGTLGIVTMEDILEELVGEIWDEDDVIAEDFKKLAAGKYLFSGDMYLSDALELLLPDREQQHDFKTLRAWALEHFDAMPKTGQSFTEDGVRVEVKSCSGFRIDSLILSVEA